MRKDFFFLIVMGLLLGFSLFAGGRRQKKPSGQLPEYAAEQVPSEGFSGTADLNAGADRDGIWREDGEESENSAAGKIDAEQGPENPEIPHIALPRQEEPDRGERIMKALAEAYPDRVGRAEYRDGDWAVPVRGEWYYYAEGRLLPEELRSKAAEYDPQPFYRYAAELAPWHEPGPEESERFREQADRRRSRPPKRSQHFFDALWRAHSRDESYDRLKTIRFLGKSVMVHYAILEELSLVEERILAESKNDPQVRAWMNRIDTLDAWSWRNIAETQSRSFHAYGAAVDILPASTGQLETYWLWTARTKNDWWTVSYEQRLHPPEAVIKAFEAYGFIWGGKWLFYDTMHFEYRPEIFILNDIPLTGLH